MLNRTFIDRQTADFDAGDAAGEGLCRLTQQVTGSTAQQQESTINSRSICEHPNRAKDVRHVLHFINNDGTPQVAQR
jgi:hypothetical protein